MSKFLFQDFDFALLDHPDFKEDSVRERLILPILYLLGYSDDGLNRIIRSRSLHHPFVKIGSQTRQITLIPDYLLLVENRPAWIWDAKSPTVPIHEGESVEQAYSYAIHPDIRTNLFALCNGHEFITFQIDQANPILYFHLSEWGVHWEKLYAKLAPSAFKLKPRPIQMPVTVSDFRYDDIKPLTEIVDLQKQSAKRHFGVHPYFTRQVWNVVQEYIKNFTQPGDTVLDPFGGTGVTFVEALILGRKGIHVDINPLSIFMVEKLIEPVDMNELALAYERIQREFAAHVPQTPAEVEQALATYPYPKDIPLPKGSDVPTLDALFAPQQLAQLAYLKHLIMQVEDSGVRGTLLLMFSGLLNKINLTFHASAKRTPGQGDSGIMRYYRYRIAPAPAFLDVAKYFDHRYRKVVAGKKDFAALTPEGTLQNGKIIKGSATELAYIPDRSIDYIYTDPPYGAKIQYLDLSILFNAWLDLPVTPEDYELEAIEGGTLEKDRQNYADLLTRSLEEMYRVLKFERWMSFVFAHKDPAYWHLIVETAEKIGFEYKGAVRQLNDKTSYKKRQNPFTVLSGQLIINFKKVKSPKAIMRLELGTNIANIIIETIEGVIAQNHGATLEEINDELIIKGLELGFLDILSQQYQDITPFLSDHFSYDDKTQKYNIRPNTSFKSRIDVRVRIRYFLISYLRRMEIQNYRPTFDEIILNIMPLLKNGVTPEEQTILNVLESIAERNKHDDRWELQKNGQLTLFHDD